MVYNGKTVYDEDQWYDAQWTVGDCVTQSVVDEAMNMLPPAYCSYELAQVGEAYSTRQDPETGKWRNTFTTYKRLSAGKDGVWEYCGDCFLREATKRGIEPTCC